MCKIAGTEEAWDSGLLGRDEAFASVSTHSTRAAVEAALSTSKGPTMKKQFVNVHHFSNGDGKLVYTKAYVRQQIECVYEDGRVRTTTGDVWTVKQVDGHLVSVA